MSETKHTPGPWTANEQKSREGRSLGWIIDAPEGRIGWASYANAESNEAEQPPYVQSGVNARLIAAAPDLLAALERVRRDGYLHHDLLTVADAAIAKARA